MSLYIVTGTTHQSNGTEGIVLEKDGQGNVTKEISATQAANLNKDELVLVRSLGVTVEKISASEAEALKARVSVSVGSDTSGAAPTFDN